MRRLLVCLALVSLALVSLAACTSLPPATPAPTVTPGPFELRIVHTNDTWGYLQPCG